MGELALLLSLLAFLAAWAWNQWALRGATASDPDGSLLNQSLTRGLCRLKSRFSRDPAATWFRLGEGLPGPATSRYCLEQAAALGHAGACLRLGERAASGGILRDSAAALHWFQRAADLGHAEGCYRSALELASQPGRSEEARRMLQRAAGMGHAEARDRLDGRPPIPAVQAMPAPVPGGGPPPWMMRLLPWVLIVLVTGLLLVLGGWMLSFILAIGTLAPLTYVLLLPAPLAFLAGWLIHRSQRSRAKASRRTRRTLDRAESGDAAALFELGLHHLKGGGGLPKDSLEARRCFLMASRAGHAGAMAELAELQRWGVGGPREPMEARAWLERAAALGHAGAKAKLEG